MKKIFTLSFLVFLSISVFSQDTIRISNPSLEDEPRMGQTFDYGQKTSVPRDWFDCGRVKFPTESPPDIHPNNYFNVTTQPSDGISYLGMVARADDSQESISQRLAGSLKKGQCYKFSVDLCMSMDYVKGVNVSTLITTPIVLRIYGGSGLCNQAVALGESDAIKNTEWRSYEFEFTPNQNIRYITFEAYYKTPILMAYDGNLLIDNLSNIVQVACPGEELLAVVKPKAKKKPPHKRKPKKEPKKEVKKEDVIVANIEKEKVKSKKILVDLDRKKLKKGQTINIDKLFFAADTTNVQPESFEVLDEVYSFLRSNQDVIVEIGGHTNNLPKHKYCDRLSEARAKEVATYLIRKGITSNRVQYKGYGKRKPIASNKTKRGRMKNQRVEIKILSLDS